MYKRQLLNFIAGPLFCSLAPVSVVSYNTAVPDFYYPAMELLHEIVLMGDHENGGSPAVDFTEQLHNFICLLYTSRCV